MTALKSSEGVRSGGRSLYVLLLLTAAYLFSQIDRAMINILMEPIKIDLGLSDTQLGLLTGLAFALFYSILGVPIAHLADRTNRVVIVVVGVALWAVMMVCTGFVTSFALLLLARVGAGAGEAGVFPSAYSLIGDYFTQERRVRAFSVFMTGVGLSIAVGYTLAGWANEAYGWRAAFIIAAGPGALLAVLAALTLREPRRRASVVALSSVSLGRALGILGRNVSFRNLLIAIVLANVAAMGVGQWAGVFYTREHMIPSAQLGLWLGLVAGVSAAAGTLMSGLAAYRWLRGKPGKQLKFAAVLTATQVPFLLLILYVPQTLVSLLFLIPLNFAFFAYNGPVLAITQGLVTARMRAVAVAATAMALNLVGTGLGPLVVGMLSDLFSPSMGTGGLKLAMLITGLTALASSGMFVRASRTVGQDMDRLPDAERGAMAESQQPAS